MRFQSIKIKPYFLTFFYKISLVVVFTEIAWFMVLKNLMENTQLNFDQPLLSVRRFSSTMASEKDDKRKTNKSLPGRPRIPSYKSVIKSGPIRNPGAVPFLWEQIPGRPKDGSKPQTRAIEQPPTAPKLPPGRILKAKHKDSDKVSEDPTHAGSQAGKFTNSLLSVTSLDENVTKFQSDKDTTGEKETSELGEGDQAYLDAFHTLSRSESFFLNCSVSSSSGLDGPDVKPSETFFTDPQTRDFMIGRFLPAAMAMASETPQHAPRKQLVVWEQLRQVKKVVNGDKRPPLLRYGSNVLSDFAQHKEEEESDDDHDDRTKLSAKVCGLLPPFCLKSSFCLLNPVPWMSVRTRVPMSPVSRTQARSSGSHNQTENEQNMLPTYEQRSLCGLQTTELHEDDSSLKDKSKQSSYQSNSRKLEGSSLYRHLHGSGMSTYCSGLPTSPFYERKGFVEIPGEAKKTGVNGFSSHKKNHNSFQELLANHNSYMEKDSVYLIEKTLYVDIVHKVESPNLKSCSSDLKGLPNLRENAVEICAKSKGMEEIPCLDSYLKDFEKLNIVDEEATLQPNAEKAVDFNQLSSVDKSEQDVEMDKVKGFGQDQDNYQDIITSANLNVLDHVKLEFEVTKAKDLERSHGSHSQFPVPPPLPKSPSDSWLWRTLPLMSSRNPSSWSYIGTTINPRDQASKTSSVDTRNKLRLYQKLNKSPLQF